MPAHLLVWHLLIGGRVLPVSGKKDRVINTVTGKIGYLLLLTLPVIEHLHKEQIGHLFKNGRWLSKTIIPECLPNGIDLLFLFACNHNLLEF